MVLEESDLALETLNLAGEDVNILGCGSDNPQLSYGVLHIGLWNALAEPMSKLLFSGSSSLGST